MKPEQIQFIAPPGHLQEIGLVTTCWSKLEWLIEELVWQLAGIDDSLVAWTLTAETGIRMQFQTLLALAGLKISGSAQETHLKEIEKRVMSGYKGEISLRAERNTIVHAYWSAGDPPAAFLSSVKARGRLNFDIRMMRDTEIHQIAEKIFAVVSELDEIQNELTSMGYLHPHDA